MLTALESGYYERVANSINPSLLFVLKPFSTQAKTGTKVLKSQAVSRGQIVQVLARMRPLAVVNKKGVCSDSRYQCHCPLDVGIVRACPAAFYEQGHR